MATRGSIEGVDGHEDESPRAKAWGRYLEQQDSFSAEEAAKKHAAEEEAATMMAAEEERRLRAQGAGRPAPEPARGPTGFSGVAAAAAATFGAAVRQALTESPEQKRMDLFAAMQAEALARLEIAPIANDAVIAQAEALGGGPAALQTDRAIAEDRRVDREAKDEELPARREDARELERRPVRDKVARGSAPAKEQPRDGRKQQK